jgi:hypothetical protein
MYFSFQSIDPHIQQLNQIKNYIQLQAFLRNEKRTCISVLYDDY